MGSFSTSGWTAGDPPRRDDPFVTPPAVERSAVRPLVTQRVVQPASAGYRVVDPRTLEVELELRRALASARVSRSFKSRIAASR